MVKPSADTWRLWLGLGLGGLAGLNVVLGLSIAGNLMPDLCVGLRPNGFGRTDPIFALV